jgi:hypothetical protein
MSLVLPAPLDTLPHCAAGPFLSIAENLFAILSLDEDRLEVGRKEGGEGRSGNPRRRMPRSIRKKGSGGAGGPGNDMRYLFSSLDGDCGEGEQRVSGGATAFHLLFLLSVCSVYPDAKGEKKEERRGKGDVAARRENFERL